jgi:glycerophosphoryl diester phosphodiesterase
VEPRPNTNSDYFDSPTPRILAHRGFAAEAPENTLLAFAKALAAGATHLETDVRASVDGVAVLSHDKDLLRLAGRSVRIDQLRFRELNRIELGHGQAYCSLAQALDTFPETPFNIDIKSAEAVEPTVAAIAAATATRRVLVTSFSDARRAAAVRLLPGVATSASSGRFLAAIAAGKLSATPLLRMAVAGLAAVQMPEHLRGVLIASGRTVRQLHALGVEVHVWTVNDVEAMARLLDRGVDGLVTDRTDLAATLVRNRR